MRHPQTDYDLGLVEISHLSAHEKHQRLQNWIRDVARECMDEPGMVLGVWHPSIRYEAVKQAWGGPVVRLNGVDSIEEIKVKLYGHS